MDSKEFSHRVSIPVVGIAATIATSAVAGIFNSIANNPPFGNALIDYSIALAIAGVITISYYGYQRSAMARTELQKSIDQLNDRVIFLTDQTLLIADLSVSSTRTDLIHRATKYIQDRKNFNGCGWITQEERDSWLSDFRKYTKLAEYNRYDNDYISHLKELILKLPSRNVEE